MNLYFQLLMDFPKQPYKRTILPELLYYMLISFTALFLQCDFLRVPSVVHYFIHK